MEDFEFELLSEITDVETIAVGNRIHDLDRLQRDYSALVKEWSRPAGRGSLV